MSQEWMCRWAKLNPEELFFVVAKFLEDGPCDKTAKVFREELEEKRLLPKSKCWNGEVSGVPFEEVERRNPHVSPDYLPLLCTELCRYSEESGKCRAKGNHSLIGNGLATCIYKRTTNWQHSNATLRLAYDHTGYSCRHLSTSLTSNRCILSAARRISPHFNQIKIIPPSIYHSMKQHRTILGHLAPVFCVAFDVSGQRFISGADDDLVKVWSSKTGSLVATLRGHSAEITDISLSRDNQMIATGSLDKTVRVWCSHTSAPLAVLCGHSGHVTSVQFSPSINDDCKYVASTAKDGCLCFWRWDPDTMVFSTVPVKFMEKNRVGDQTLCSAFSPGGIFFVTGGTDCIVRVYQCVPFPPVLLAELPGHTDRIMTIQFSNTPICTFATGSCDGLCCLWQYRWSKWSSTELTVNKKKQNIAVATTRSSGTSKGEKPFPHQVTMIGWEITDTYLVTAHTPDCHLRVWRVNDGQIVSTLQGHTGEVFVVECHPTNSRILLSAGHDGQVIIWDMVANVILKKFLIQYEDEGIGLIFDCKWSPGGTIAVAADHLGYLTVLGFGSSEPYEKVPDEQFFHTDYRPLMRDRNHFVVDEQSQLPPYLLPPPYLVDIDGHPHPLKHQDGILAFIRPAKLVRQDRPLEEMEDYDEYMKKHFSAVKNRKRRLGRGRSIENNKGLEGPGDDQKSENQNFEVLDVENDAETSNHGNNSELMETERTGLLEQEERTKNSHDEVVDVTEEGMAGAEGGDNIQNMLSSIVYSLGLTDEEVQEAIRNWHKRNILPLLDIDVCCSEIARLRDLEEKEQQLYQLESERQVEVPSPEVVKSPSPQGRSLRSGRTIPEHQDISEPPSPLSVGNGCGEEERESDRDYNNDGWDSASTASSDISDWTNEVGINWQSSSSRRSRRTKRRESVFSEVFSDGITIDEEEAASSLRGEESNEEKGTRKRKLRGSQGDEPPTKRKKVKSLKNHVSKEIDYSMYWPPSWLKMTKPQLSPYFPQVGDIVVYFRQGHELYREEVRKEKPYQWKTQQMPWDKYNLRPQEFCQVRNVHFVVGPPTLCSITLALLSPTPDQGPGSSQQSSNSSSISFTFKYHDMDGVLDFLILESVYKCSLKKQWNAGDRFQSFIDGSYWRGMILSKKPYQEEFPNSHWQCFHIKWDDGATDQLSPWDMEAMSDDLEGEISTQDQSTPRLIFPLTLEDPVTAWGGEGEGERKRIIRGLDVVMETLEESEMFSVPVDIEEEVLYCTVVPFPTDLSTILERMKNRFYRRKLALIWDIVALDRNASSYNEQDSVIVEHSKILNRTLLKFIKSPGCSNPLECYRPEIDEREESTQEVTAPEVEFVEAEEVFTAPAEVTEAIMTTPKKRRKKVLSSEEEDEENNNDNQLPWLPGAVNLLDKLASSDNAFPFQEPVDVEQYSDYPLYVSCPMDLTTIRNKLYDKEYFAPKDLISDIKLMFSNAKSYNQPRSPVYKMACELQLYFEKELLEFLKTCTNEEASTGRYGTRRALKRLAQSSSSTTSGTTSIRSFDETFEGEDYHWTRRSRRGLTNGDADNSSSDNEQQLGSKAQTRERYKRKGRSVGQGEDDENTGMMVTRSRSSRQQEGCEKRSCDRSCDRVGGSIEKEPEEDDNELTEEESEEEEEGGEGVESLEVTIPRRSMRTRSSIKVKEEEEERYMFPEGEEEEEEDLTSEDTYPGRRRRRSIRTRKSVRVKDLKVECEDGVEEEEEDVAAETNYMYPRRSLRPRSTVKNYSVVVEDDEVQGDTPEDEEVCRTTRTGRVIRPTVRYS